MKPQREEAIPGIPTAQHNSKSQQHVSAVSLKKGTKKKAKVVYCLCHTKYRVIRKVCSSFPGWVECENEDDDWVRINKTGRKQTKHELNAKFGISGTQTAR